MNRFTRKVLTFAAAAFSFAAGALAAPASATGLCLGFAGGVIAFCAAIATKTGGGDEE